MSCAPIYSNITLTRSMFVHRVRDADPAIRTECLRELGVWAKKYGQMYIDIQYLNYFTRGCNDPVSSFCSHDDGELTRRTRKLV